MDQQDEAQLRREPLLDIEGLARHVRVKSTNTVRGMIRRRELPPPDLRVGGRFPRWVAARVDAWIARRADEARTAVEERLAADDPVSAKNELAKLERAVGGRNRDAC